MMYEIPQKVLMLAVQKEAKFFLLLMMLGLLLVHFELKIKAARR